MNRENRSCSERNMFVDESHNLAKWKIILNVNCVIPIPIKQKSMLILKFVYTSFKIIILICSPLQITIWRLKKMKASLLFGIGILFLAISYAEGNAFFVEVM